MRARVFVTLKPSVFDPQGKTVTDALHTLGYLAVKDVRQGKYFELDIDARRPDEARALAAEADRAVAEAGGEAGYDVFYDEASDTPYESFAGAGQCAGLYAAGGGPSASAATMSPHAAGVSG